MDPISMFVGTEANNPTNPNKPAVFWSILHFSIITSNVKPYPLNVPLKIHYIYQYTLYDIHYINIQYYVQYKLYKYTIFTKIFHYLHQMGHNI